MPSASFFSFVPFMLFQFRFLENRSTSRIPKGAPNYPSARSASVGSTLNARRVGTMHASRHTPIMTTA